jgi:hypothetical protein
LKYPHLVHAAVSASSPMTALTDFGGLFFFLYCKNMNNFIYLEYLVVVRNSLATYNEQCNEAISNATKIMQHMIASSAGRSDLKKAFR